MKKILTVCLLFIAIALSLMSCDSKTVEMLIHTHHFDEWEVIKQPTCTENGEKIRFCECGEKQTTVILATHTPREELRSNVVDATCYKEGSYDAVVYCSECGIEYEKVTRTIEKTAHTPKEAVEENRVEATYEEDGSYDMVVYCSVAECGEELERTKHVIDMLNHRPGTAVIENEIVPTCTLDGSYDKVVYCLDADCGYKELSRETVIIDQAPHTSGEAKEEGRVEATCHSKGSYDTVIYCTVCNSELSRSTVSIGVIPHSPADAVKENELDPTCTESGVYDSVVYCTVCTAELSREAVTVVAPGHKVVVDAAVDPSCGSTGLTEGSHCSACREIFVKQEILEATGHSFGEGNICVGCGFYLDEGLVFEECGSSYAVIEYKGNAETVSIPDTYNGKPVVEIGNYSFYDNKNLTSIIIPDGVTRIGSDAFYGCTNLVSITLPDTLLSLEAWAFYNCTSLAYNFYDNACYLGSEKNPYMVLVKTVDQEIESCEIHPKTKFLYYSSFRNCSNLVELTIPESVIHIGGYVFEGCSSLQYNEYDNAYYLGSRNNPYYALIEAKERWAITSCEINENTKLISGRAFASCSKLTSIDIPYGIKSINFRAFEFCYELTEVNIPDSVIYIEHEAFFYCTGLNSIIIPDSVEAIGRSAFDRTSIENVVLGSGIEKVDNLAFAGGSNRSIVYYNGTKDEWERIFVEPAPSYSYGCNIDDYTRYYYSESEPDGDGYWHYVDGVPTLW